MELVVLRIHAQLFPNGENKEECIVGRGDGVGILELETVVLETEHLHLAVVEIGIEFGMLAGEALLIHVAPNRRHQRLIADGAEAVGQHLTQVLLYGKHSHSVQVGQDGMHDNHLFLSRKCIMIQLVALLLTERVDGKGQYGGVGEHQHLLVVVLKQELGSECLAHVRRQ